MPKLLIHSAVLASGIAVALAIAFIIFDDLAGIAIHVTFWPGIEFFAIGIFLSQADLSYVDLGRFWDERWNPGGAGVILLALGLVQLGASILVMIIHDDRGCSETLLLPQWICEDSARGVGGSD